MPIADRQYNALATAAAGRWGGASLPRPYSAPAQAIAFDGTTGGVLADNDSIETTGRYLWISALFRTHSSLGTLRPVFCRRGTGGAAATWLLYVGDTSTQLRLAYANGPSEIRDTAIATIAANTWYHVVACQWLDGAAHRLHWSVNGGAWAQYTTTPGPLNEGGADIEVGVLDDLSWNHRGRISLLAMGLLDSPPDESLRDAIGAGMYRAGYGRRGRRIPAAWQPVLAWDMDDDTGGTVPDQTGNGNDLVLTNSAGLEAGWHA